VIISAAKIHTGIQLVTCLELKIDIKVVRTIVLLEFYFLAYRIELHIHSVVH
jgi:hypothetical protein